MSDRPADPSAPSHAVDSDVMNGLIEAGDAGREPRVRINKACPAPQVSCQATWYEAVGHLNRERSDARYYVFDVHVECRQCGMDLPTGQSFKVVKKQPPMIRRG